MKIETKCKIERVVSKDPDQYVLANPYLDFKEDKPVLIGTDGHALVSLTVSAEKSETGYVPVEAITEARRLAKRREEIEITLNGDCKLANGATFKRPEGQFANWRQVTKNVEDQKPVYKIVLNTNLLANVAAALGSENGIVQIEFFEKNRPMRIMVGEGFNNHTRKDRFGLLMPFTPFKEEEVAEKEEK